MLLTEVAVSFRIGYLTPTSHSLCRMAFALSLHWYIALFCIKVHLKPADCRTDRNWRKWAGNSWFEIMSMKLQASLNQGNMNRTSETSHRISLTACEPQSWRSSHRPKGCQIPPLPCSGSATADSSWGLRHCGLACIRHIQSPSLLTTPHCWFVLLLRRRNSFKSSRCGMHAGSSGCRFAARNSPHATRCWACDCLSGTDVGTMCRSVEYRVLSCHLWKSFSCQWSDCKWVLLWSSRCQD